jgi:hypothetical protein
MLTLVFASVTFIGGVYVGARWSEKIKDIYFSIVSR